ncbi:EF-hand calcium-binding domain-containing protein 1 [Nematolebias whitei]|uniref:EF-hand calcium-binding domain-containing protein 1 n=1 Tax=Nematolebias whitei TaxID=451745 RepID=UPI001897F006|nr:EF-hand calcium-binding domain-containing protein 1 [Nematolebias whitei]
MFNMSAMNRRLIKDLAKTMSKNVEHFDKTETECLVREFYVLLDVHVSPGKECQGVDRERFRGFLHSVFGMSRDTMMDGVFRAFDKDRDGFISLKEWIQGLSVFLRGTLDEQIKHCFSVYDLNGDQFISRAEMLHLLKDSLHRRPTEDDSDEDYDPAEGVKELVDMTMSRMDADGDGRVSFEDFQAAVKRSSLLLEAFGPCLPDASPVEKFEQQVFTSSYDDVL